MKLNHCFLYFSLVGSLGSLGAQELEFMFFERSGSYYQSDATTVGISTFEDAPFHLYAGADLVSGSFNHFQVSDGEGVLEIEQEDENEWENEVPYDSANELSSDIPAGTYTFSGDGPTVGNFSIPLSVPSMDLPTPIKVTNWANLQNVDPAQPLVVEFEAFTDYDVEGVLDLEVSSWNGNFTETLWMSEENRTDDIPGLALDTTSVTIPAGTLQGNPDGFYDLWIFIASIRSMDEAPASFNGGQVVVIDTAQIHVSISVEQPAQEWAGYPWYDASGDLTTDRFLGWLNVRNAPWVWSYALSKYLYLPEGNVKNSGAWVYVRK